MYGELEPSATQSFPLQNFNLTAVILLLLRELLFEKPVYE